MLLPGRTPEASTIPALCPHTPPAHRGKGGVHHHDGTLGLAQLLDARHIHAAQVRVGGALGEEQRNLWEGEGRPRPGGRAPLACLVQTCHPRRCGDESPPFCRVRCLEGLQAWQVPPASPARVAPHVVLLQSALKGPQIGRVNHRRGDAHLGQDLRRGRRRPGRQPLGQADYASWQAPARSGTWCTMRMSHALEHAWQQGLPRRTRRLESKGAGEARMRLTV